MRSPRTWVLWTLLLLWTLGLGAAVARVVTRPVLTLHLGGLTLFAAEPWQLLAVWALGALLGVALLAPLPLSRRLAVALWSGLALAACGWAVARLVPRHPETAPPGGARTAAARHRTTLLVGVDGMSWTAILPLVRAGKLPNLARLMEEGSYGVLHSLRSHRNAVDEWGFWSPVVWTSIATGVVPRRHGITGFVVPDDSGKVRMATSDRRRAPAFWNLFSAFGHRVAVVGWWATWPAEKVSGFMASSDLGLRGRRQGQVPVYGLTYPPGLLDELPRTPATPKDFEGWVNREVFPFDQYPSLLKKDLPSIYSVLWQDRLYLNIARYLIRKDSVDLYAVYFEGTDALSHFFWASAFGETGNRATPVSLPEEFDEDAEIIPRYYRVIDRYVGQLLDLLPDDTTVILCSDHGFHVDPAAPHHSDHSPYGVLIARGPGIARGRDLNLEPLGSLRGSLGRPIGVLDILPTLLYLHHLPIAETLDGHVIGSLLTDRALDEIPVVRVASYGDFARDRTVSVVDDGVTEEYQKRLKALGYVQ